MRPKRRTVEARLPSPGPQRPVGTAGRTPRGWEPGGSCPKQGKEPWSSVPLATRGSHRPGLWCVKMAEGAQSSSQSCALVRTFLRTLRTIVRTRYEHLFVPIFCIQMLPFQKPLRASAKPLDAGSWNAQPDIPGRPLPRLSPGGTTWQASEPPAG